MGSKDQASYGKAEGITVQDVADERAKVMLKQLRKGQLTLEPYGRSEQIAVTYVLAMGPPNAVLTLLVDRDHLGNAFATGGTYEYGEPIGTAAVSIGQRDAQELYDLLEQD